MSKVQVRELGDGSINDTISQTNKRMSRCQIRLVTVLILLFAGWVQSQQDNYQVIVLYEAAMNDAARNWLAHNYAAALDDFDSAKKILLVHMPLPSDGFFWNTFHSLEIYTVLLTRLVEVERYQNEEDTELSAKAKTQAKDWADDLRDQTKKWMALESPSLAEDSMRLKWIKRFYSVIQKVKTEF